MREEWLTRPANWTPRTVDDGPPADDRPRATASDGRDERADVVDEMIARWPSVVVLPRRSSSIIAAALLRGDPTDRFVLGSWTSAFLVLVGGVAQMRSVPVGLAGASAPRPDPPWAGEVSVLWNLVSRHHRGHRGEDADRTLRRGARSSCPRPFIATSTAPQPDAAIRPGDLPSAVAGIVSSASRSVWDWPGPPPLVTTKHGPAARLRIARSRLPGRRARPNLRHRPSASGPYGGVDEPDGDAGDRVTPLVPVSAPSAAVLAATSQT